MTTTIDQKSYLQKYLSGPSSHKKDKKKKKKVSKGKGFKIIDDDIDITKLRALEGDELDILGEGEDAPQVAGIIDERPEEVKKLEQFNTTSKWRVINQDDGFNSKLKIEEIKKDIKEVEKENEIIFGKMYSDSEDEKKDSDASPPRSSKTNENPKIVAKKPKSNSDSDFSPPRRNKEESLTRKEQPNQYDSDLSPPRIRDNQKSKERVRKPSRWGANDQEQRQNSPESRQSRKRHSHSSAKKSKIKSPDSYMSPPRKSQNYDSDVSPPRKSRKESPHRRHKSPDSDMSPPRKSKQSKDQKNDKYNNKQKSNFNKIIRHKNSDLSPPRKRNKNQNSQSSRKSRNNSDSDLSPPRKGKETCRRTSDSPPPTNKKMAKTLEGKLAGLQDAAQLRQENEAFRKREEEAFKRMGDEISGRNAQVTTRRSKRETSEERSKQKEKAERQKELDEKYKRWNKGLKQMEDQEARVQEFLHESSKPLARHKDDRDLERNLKEIERDGDPMLQYIRERKRERGELGPEKPTYKGNFPPNRFNIRPGHRWDGVDRSNGYEKKYFDQQSKNRAREEEIYKWSTEDL